MAGPVALGTQSVLLFATPSSPVGNTPITVTVGCSTCTFNNSTGFNVVANNAEIDAVISLNNVDYTLRGSQNLTTVANGQALFQPGLVISSAPGGSSATSVGSVAGTSGIGATVRGLEQTPVTLLAPGLTGTYTIGFKGFVTNLVFGINTPQLTNNLDVITNADPTNAGGGPGTVGPGGPTGSFALNTGNGLTAGSGNIIFSSPQTLAVSGPNGTITAATGQNANVQAFRSPSNSWLPATTTVGLSGTLWGNNVGVGGFTVQFCTSAGLSCTGVAPGTGLLNNVLTTNASGVLTGSFSLSRVTCSGILCNSAMTPTGNRAIKLTQGINQALIPVLVLADPVVSVSPSNGGPGMAVQVSGSNFNPGQTVNISGYKATCPGTCTLTADGINSTATASGVGALASTTYTVNDLTTIGLVAYQGAITPLSAANQLAAAPYELHKTSCTADVGNVNTGSCYTRQSVFSTITAGDLSQAVLTVAPGNPDNKTIQLCAFAAPVGPVVGTTAPCAATSPTGVTQWLGTLNPVTVTDTRGGTFGWSLTATLDPITDGTHTIPKANLSITPSCAPAAVGSATGITAGATQVFGGTVALCTKNTTADSTGGTSGGQYVISAPLTLTVPAFQAAGNYNSGILINLA